MAIAYDNAVMEAFFSTVKNEVGERYDSHGDAKGQLFDYIEVFYNQRRRHSSAGRMSPAAFERKMTSSAIKPSTETDQAQSSRPIDAAISARDTASPSTERDVCYFECRRQFFEEHIRRRVAVAAS